MLIDETIYIPLKSCPLCSAKESKLIKTETNNFYSNNQEEKKFFTVYEKDPVFLQLCQNCDFVYLDKLPKEKIFFEKVYSQVKYDYQHEFKYHGKKDIYEDIKQNLKKYCASGTLLDIGTWCGTLLAFMADAYSTVGCEISEPAANYGKSMGLDIRIGSFDSVNFAPQSFDIITIIDVLEHLPEPKNVLNKIFTLLKPGGILYIKVPNIQAQINKQSILQFWNLSSEGVCQNYVHINHFNHKSLTTILSYIGFEVLEAGYTKAEVWDLNFSSKINWKIKKWTTNQIKKSLTATVNLISHISPFDLGFNIYVTARRAQKTGNII